MALFNRVTIVGLGLIGGSLGMAARRKHLARVVIGVSRRPATLRRAKRLGAIDIGTTDFRRAVRDADLVVLATPVEDIAPLAERAAALMRPGSMLTDVGSTKAAIVNRLERTLPRGIAFVGGHPIAGSEQQGIEAADPHLFDGAVCVLTKTGRTKRAALLRVRRLWASLVDQVVIMNPRQHDRLLARTSHLPHLVACALIQATQVAPLPRAPRSFLDMTRIAKSPPELWREIVFSNRAELLAAMQRFDRQWRTLRACLTSQDRRGLQRMLARAQMKRNALDS